MKICVKCRREMRCTKNGIGADFGNGHIYPTDKFECPECGIEVLDSGNQNAYQDPDHKIQQDHLEMKQGAINGPE